MTRRGKGKKSARHARRADGHIGSPPPPAPELEYATADELPPDWRTVCDACGWCRRRLVVPKDDGGSICLCETCSYLWFDRQDKKEWRPADNSVTYQVDIHGGLARATAGRLSDMVRCVCRRCGDVLLAEGLGAPRGAPLGGREGLGDGDALLAMPPGRHGHRGAAAEHPRRPGARGRVRGGAATAEGGGELTETSRAGRPACHPARCSPVRPRTPGRRTERRTV